MTLICCMCNKKEDDDFWTDEFKLSENELVSHGYCPHCYNEIMEEIKDVIGDIWMDGSCDTDNVSAS